MKGRDKQVIQFGDFQTPGQLAGHVCKLLARLGVHPASILEPTCGLGQLLLAAAHQFSDARSILGVEINPDYVAALRKSLPGPPSDNVIEAMQADFFELDWHAIINRLPKPLLVIGNPPWVTNARVGGMGGDNLPMKDNSRRYRGIEAITGKSNFDISEWMISHLLERLTNEPATLAMLCKTSVARRVLVHAWKSGRAPIASAIHLVDAGLFFVAAVDACLLVCRTGGSGGTSDCLVYGNLDTEEPQQCIGYRAGQLVANTARYEQWKHLQGESPYRWRSGIKHDCARVMELRRVGRMLVNGLGETVDIEEDHVLPMLKSSDLVKTPLPAPRRWMLVPQTAVGDDTRAIQRRAPRTWAYLERHGSLLDMRASTIYKRRPRFAIFGVGPYTFAPWKVAISGLYKSLDFRVVGSTEGKPIVLDDTANFLPCRSQEEAECLHSLLSGAIAREFYEAFVQWDAKRPVTIDVLQRLDLAALAAEMDKLATFNADLAENKVRPPKVVAGGPVQESFFFVTD